MLIANPRFMFYVSAFFLASAITLALPKLTNIKNTDVHAGTISLSSDI